MRNGVVVVVVVVAMQKTNGLYAVSFVIIIHPFAHLSTEGGMKESKECVLVESVGCKSLQTWLMGNVLWAP